MSELLASVRVLPFHGQVVVEADGASDLPVFATGEEKAVATALSILVATRGEKEGVVTIEVWRQEAEESGHLIVEGELSFSAPRLTVGSPLANQLASVDVGRIGWGSRQGIRGSA